MIIHFVAQDFDYNVLSMDARRMDVSEENHDPLSGIINFHRYFDRIDGRGEREVLWLDSEKVRKAFWDRDEFIDALRESSDDVYVQASDYYSAKLMFLRQADHEKFVARLAERRGGFERRFDNSLHGEVVDFLKNQCGALHENDWVVTRAQAPGGDDIYLVRDETVAGMLEIKFAFTKQGDHSKPPPSLEECRQGVVPIAA
jgi:hypothetical protein